MGPIKMKEMFHIEIISLIDLGWECVPGRTRATYLLMIQKRRNNSFEEKVGKLEVRAKR